MSFTQLFNIASSGMSAQSIRLNTISSNLANAETASSTEAGAYRAREPVFQTGERPFEDAFNSALANSGVGVKVDGIVESNAPVRKEYNPNSPLANQDGYVFMPNVTVSESMANMISASRAYQTNVEVMNTGKQMMMQTLQMGN